MNAIISIFKSLKLTSMSIGRVLPVILFFILSACSGSLPQSPEKLGLETPKFTIPEPTTWKLPNGLEVYYYHNEELPVMRARLYIQGGSLFDEFGAPGLAGVTGSQLREGGTKGYSPEKLDSYLDSMAAKIESSMGEEYGTVSLFCLTEDFDELFPLFASVVREPGFSKKRISLWKTLAMERIRRRKDDPGTIRSMVFAEQLYGRGSKFAEYSGVDSVKKISQKLLREFHQEFYRPQRGKLAISGSLPRAKVEKAIAKVFGDWAANSKVVANELNDPTLERVSKPGIYLIKRDLDQASISVGHLGPERHTKDFYSIRVFSEIFGSGFSGMLFKEIRTKRGLAYSVYGGIWPGFIAGSFQVGLQTRKQEAISAISEVLRLSKYVSENEPDVDSFNGAKASVERSFVFKFAEPDSIVDRAVMLDTLKYPHDFDERYLERIAAVSPEDVRLAAQKWINVDDLVIVIVGGVEPDELAKSFPGLSIYSVEFDSAPGKIVKLRSPK